jgi:hypothetical protein
LTIQFTVGLSDLVCTLCCFAHQKPGKQNNLGGLMQEMQVLCPGMVSGAQPGLGGGVVSSNQQQQQSVAAAAAAQSAPYTTRALTV